MEGKYYNKEERPIDYVKIKPLLAVMEVWRNGGLDLYRDELYEWCHLALSSKDASYDDADDRSQFVLFFDDLIWLIEAMYFFTRDEKMQKTDKLELSNRPLKMSESSPTDPFYCIKDFCTLFSIEYVRIEMWDFLEAVGIYRGNLEIKMDIPRMFSLYLNIMVLVEAAYIISRKPNTQ